MRFGEKGTSAFTGEKQLLGVDLRDSTSKEANALTMETASEFGLTGQDIKKLKKLLERN